MQNSSVNKTKQNRLVLVLIRLIKNQEANGLLSTLGIRTTLINVPLNIHILF